MDSQQVSVQIVANLLASAQYDVVARMTRNRNFTAEQLSELVRGTGVELRELPEAAVESLDVEQTATEPPTYRVEQQLTTASTDAVAVVLTLELADVYGGGGYEVTVIGLERRSTPD